MNEQIEQQRQTWNKYSSGWKKWDGFMRNLMNPVSEAMIKLLELMGNEQVLDIASGTGEPGQTAGKLLPDGKVIAIDLSEKMVAIANEFAKERGIANYQSQVAEVSNMPFERNSFDAIICRFGMMFFPDVRQSLQEMIRVLKPGGKLAVAVWADPQQNPFLSVMGLTVMEKLKLPKPPPDAPGIFRFAKPGLSSQVISDSGFGNIKEQNIKGEVSFNSGEQFWELSSEVAGPIMEAMKNAPPEMVGEIKELVISKAKAFTKRDGKIYLNWEAIVITGVKK